MLPQAGFRRLTRGMRMPTSWRNRLWSFTVPGAIALAGVCLMAPVYRLQGLPWPQAVAAALMVAVPGIALGWGVWRFALRQRALAAHIAAAPVFSLAWTACIALLALSVDAGAAAAFLRNVAAWQMAGGLVVYGAIAATARAVRTQAHLAEREAAATAAELQALRARLDPHFLFNTLHSLSHLVRHDPAATEVALERFGALMRYVLEVSRKGATDDVALEQELDFLRNYLALERLRLGDRLWVVETIEEDAMELAVPPLLLQPLVENAVRHGIAPRRMGGTIRIAAVVRNGALALEVGDDGVGMTLEACMQSDGLGLSTIRRLLAARFPDEGGMDIVTAPGAGFTVRLRLPAGLPAKGRRT
jgi:LytS/YehU family sensor histidine kinase